MRPTSLLLLSSVALQASCAPAAGPDPLLVAGVDSIVAEYAESGVWHGGMLVSSGGEVVFRGASGERDAQAGLPNSADQRFDLLSVTKPFTAVMALQMVAEGSLELGGTLARYLPTYGGAGADMITVHHLLSHRSGLPDYTMLIPNYWEEMPELGPDSIISLMAREPLEFEPGEAFGYSNSGYLLLARILEEVSGDSYGDLVSRRIFEPLGMASSVWVPQPAHEQGVSVGYRNGDAVLAETVQIGEAGIVSTLDDVLRFASAIGSEVLLPAELWAEALTPHSTPAEASRFHPGHFQPYGYGFGLGEVSLADGRGVRTAMHGGSGAGGSAMLVRFLDGDAVLIVWNNLGELQPSYPELEQLIATASVR